MYSVSVVVQAWSADGGDPQTWDAGEIAASEMATGRRDQRDIVQPDSGWTRRILLNIRADGMWRMLSDYIAPNEDVGLWHDVVRTPDICCDDVLSDAVDIAWAFAWPKEYAAANAKTQDIELVGDPAVRVIGDIFHPEK